MLQGGNVSRYWIAIGLLLGRRGAGALAATNEESQREEIQRRSRRGRKAVRKESETLRENVRPDRAWAFVQEMNTD